MDSINISFSTHDRYFQTELEGTMKTERVFLDELNANSRGYKVKVRVIEKNRAKESPEKKVTYQSLLLEDDKGQKMKAALFGDQVEGYKDVIAYNGEYDIANAIIRPLNERWKGDPSLLDYQMSFGKYTIVQPIDGSYERVMPQYGKISLIPKFADCTERFDILAVVLFVEDPPGKVVTFANRSSTVREFLITDDSVQQPLVVSAWHDLTGEDCGLLHASAAYFPVIGITALKPSPHKGFSLTTTMSITIIHDPEGDHARNLQTWVSQNRQSLTKTRLKILAIKSGASASDVTSVRSLRSKKAAEVFQDEKHSLEITIPEAEFEKINAYVGCSVCGKATGTPVGKAFGCEICHRSQCVAAPKVTFKCEVSDGTGNLPLTLFTEACEKVFGLSAADIFHMRQSGALEMFATIQQRLETTPLIVQVVPSTALTKNRVLQWVLHEVNLLSAKEDAPVKTDIEEEAAQQDTHTTADLVGSTAAKTAKDLVEEVPASKGKQVRTKGSIPSAKRRLILPASSDSSENAGQETTLVDDMVDALSTYSNEYEPNGSPSPSPSPKTPFDG